jgi:SEC-C motif-containing protein
MRHDWVVPSNPLSSGSSPCPCGRGRSFGDCCGRIHRGDAPALTAEDLMRSRFSAFAVGDAAYLLHSWHPDTRPGYVRFVPDRRWTRLDVIDSRGGPLDSEGIVEFDAHHEQGGIMDVMHERSRFSRHDGRWVYVGPFDDIEQPRP